jgi:hypothetical protein
MPQREERVDLHRAQEAARACERAARQFAEFAEHLSVVVTPAELAEYDELLSRETAALSQRVEAFQRLGLAQGSVDATGVEDYKRPPRPAHPG